MVVSPNTRAFYGNLRQDLGLLAYGMCRKTPCAEHAVYVHTIAPALLCFAVKERVVVIQVRSQRQH
jgi:hypothetical protein